MGKTADLTVVQKTIIDTLHKEGKTQTFITKEAVHRVLYPSMFTESWVEEKSVEEKDAQPTERTAALWGLSSKIDSRIWVKFTRNGLRLGSRHQEHHTQTCQATVPLVNPLLNHRQRQRRLTWPANSPDLNPRESMRYCTYTVNEHTFQKANIHLKCFCIGLMKYSNFLWIGGFLLNVSQNHHN